MQNRNRFSRVVLLLIQLIGLCAGIFAPRLLVAHAAPVYTNALDVVINEIAWGGTVASSSDQWIELFNTTASPINLTNWKIVTLDGNPGAIVIPSGVIPANGFFLLERAEKAVNNITAAYVYGGNNFSISGEVLQLEDSLGFSVDTANSGSSTGWYGGTATPNYYSMERKGVLSDGPTAWASNNGVIRNGLDAAGNPINGTPGQPNSVAFPTQTPTYTNTPTDTDTPTSTSTGTITATGTPPTSTPTLTPTTTLTPTPASPLNVLINEVAWAGNVNLSNDEWIELYNTGTMGINLNGWSLKIDDGSSETLLISFNSSDVIPANDFFLMARAFDVFT